MHGTCLDCLVRSIFLRRLNAEWYVLLCLLYFIYRPINILVAKKNSVLSNFVMQPLKRFRAQLVKILNIETEKSEQTVFAPISLSNCSDFPQH